MFCTKTCSWLLLVSVCCNFVGKSSTEIWRSGGMARSACEQWEEFNKTGVIPKPIKDVGSTKLCGWFSKGTEGDACADIRHYWLGCKIGKASTRIIGGSPARKNKFPSWIGMSTRCGGSIINEEWVLTAAHCIDGQVPGYNMLNSEGVRVSSSQEYFKHPQYNASIVLNDIGLIKISPKLNWSEGSMPVRLPKENAFHTEGIIGVTIGWGQGSKGILNEVELPVITTEKCKEVYDAIPNKEDNATITDDYVCGYYPDGDVRTPCYGDSGSPFYVCEDNKLVQIGVTDFGGDCMHNDPEVFVRVSKYINWIKETIAQNTNSTNATKAVNRKDMNYNSNSNCWKTLFMNSDSNSNAFERELFNSDSNTGQVYRFQYQFKYQFEFRFEFRFPY